MTYAVAVRALCEFTAKQGDLDLRFTPSPTAQEGIAGHAVVAGRRGATYQTEVSLSGTHLGSNGLELLVRGRADGYDPGHNLIEEVKTYRGELARMPDNHRHLHWAQVRVYGHLLCRQLGLAQVNLALVYFDIGRETETVLRETQSAEALAAIFADQCERFAAWAAQEAAHRTARDTALGALRFPHPDFRPGQRDLAETIFKANASGRCVMAQAPTGIGKTIGTLFPVLKAAPAQQIDKVFFLAAKTPGRRLVIDAAATITGSAPLLPLRVQELVARDKACEHPDKACHGDSCPLAQGFYDRLPAARSAAAAVAVLDRDAMREVALAHAVCPYYLGSEMAKWSDLLVGDYNYYFDLGAMLYSMTLANQWKVSVLVDEAHNMVARARQMYSAELDRVALRAARAVASGPVRTALDRVARAWPVHTHASYEVIAAIPDKLLTALQGAGSTITDFVSDNPAPMEPALQRFYFDALHFARLAEQFGDHSLFDATIADPKNSTLCIRNIVPAPFLKARFAMSHATALFSATLSPWNYYGDMLGLPDNSPWVDIASPFAAEQLAVHVVDTISTRFQHRASSAAPIARLIARQYQQQPGNYLAFFSSFDYMEQVAAQLAQQYPEVPLFRQPRRMVEAERDQFLGRFTLDSRGVGFAVLGGSFGEGIDLPGARLIGAFVATLGLPQLNPVNEQIRQRMQAIFGAGYNYTYLYPGIQKVVQAAGRVIRTEQDRGVVYLIDDRFAQPDVQDLLPRWWKVDRPGISRSGS
ncbi:ATP-dependent DNA helicase [Massilia sp. PAMC28688]|uniref:ATP-dependent DNA helicase n=1 Tax=Massilia sp. PAMC28688 TaxID=2861283 RepID=UPI001C63B7DD|nr:ATP-dependent DNA helicase [Massilia sp. PAMC28688]QYF93503.1 ATP-dependent DNA helicase [Massilia sp. PAMC28688]